MKKTIISTDIINKYILESGLQDIGKGSIREIVQLVNDIEKESGIKYIRMEMGVPGLPSSQIAIDAEINALKNGVSSIYPPMEGISELKTEASRFLKLFADISISPQGCLPAVGSMQASMAALMATSLCIPGKNKTLFIDPGFPVQKLQCSALGNGSYSFDIINFRGPKLKDKIESYLKKGDVANILYSNPNNPSWVCLTDEELKTIAELADKYNVIVIEDLAYFGMDFRENIEEPGIPPFQPTINKYTDNCILLISGSKVFSYAGQRIAILAIPDSLFLSHFKNLSQYFNTEEFGHAIIFGALYTLSAGTSHSAQYALAALFKAVNQGKLKFISEIREYEQRAKIMKQLFTDNGFEIVYNNDLERPISDGFYFTIGYPGFSGSQLMKELLYYGISAVTLDITGSTKEGLRACVSQFKLNNASDLEKKLRLFRENHP